MHRCDVVCVLAATLLVVSTVTAQEIEVTLLGTGFPVPTLDQFGPSTLIEAGDQILVVDTGRGAMQRLFQLGVSYADIDAIFLTHLHSDHVVGLPDLWLTGWLISGRDRPLALFGPEGTAELVENLRKAYSFDIEIRISDDLMAREGSRLQVTEIRDGYIYERDGVSVKAFDVDHRPVSPALGYRIEYGGRSVLLSGDTRYSENLISNAEDLDLLIHEVSGATEEYLQIISPGDRRAFEHHTTAEQAGKIFAQTRPKLAAYSHVVLWPGYERSRLIRDTRQTYEGPLVVGVDLMRFLVGDEVDVLVR